MSAVIILIAFTTIWVLGLSVATQPNMVLHFLREKVEEKKSNWYKPLIICVWCMPSLHGIIGYLFAFGTGSLSGFGWDDVLAYPIVVCGSSFLSGILWTIYETIDIIGKYYTNVEKLTHWEVKDRKQKHFNQKNGG